MADDLVIGQDSRPSAAPEDAHGRTAFALRIVLEFMDQRQPVLAAIAAAGNDGAVLVAVGLADLCHRRRFDVLAGPSHPEQCLAGKHIALDSLEIAQVSLMHRGFDEIIDQ